MNQPEAIINAIKAVFHCDSCHYCSPKMFDQNPPAKTEKYPY
ncbi:conserved hypothetical protein [delta proteobacterium NaphS2]|nr:conserved hypothetical protein [delta proteobacterium NaphS2]